MSEPKSGPMPYSALGTHLKYLREQQQETLAEVSGAVEIGIENLERFEQGLERPSEDILLLMISHFGIADTGAGQLWELAGYDQPVVTTQMSAQDFKIGGKQQMLMVLALDMRTLYSDKVETSVNGAGVVVNFSQIGGQAEGNGLPVARIGMSVEQANRVVDSIQQALLKAQYLQGPKQLPSGVSGQTKRKTPKSTRSRTKNQTEAKKRHSDKDPKLEN